MEPRFRAAREKTLKTSLLAHVSRYDTHALKISV